MTVITLLMLSAGPAYEHEHEKRISHGRVCFQLLALVFQEIPKGKLQSLTWFDFMDSMRRKRGEVSFWQTKNCPICNSPLSRSFACDYNINFLELKRFYDFRLRIQSRKSRDGSVHLRVVFLPRSLIIHLFAVVVNELHCLTVAKAFSTHIWPPFTPAWGD